MASVFNYLFGNDGAAGIATISGDAGGFSYIDEPLDADKILGTLEAVLKEEDKFNAEEKAELMEDAALEIEKIHAKHVERYTAYRACH